MARPKVAVLFDCTDRGLIRGASYVGNSYRFFIKGLKASERLNIVLHPLWVVPKPPEYNRYDALILLDLWNTQRDYNYLADCHAAKIARGPDAHKITPGFIDKCRTLPVEYVFNMCSHKYVRNYLPADIFYRQFFFGITVADHPSPPWRSRIADKLLVTGTIKSERHYKLRTACCDLPYTEYVGRDAGYTADRFGALLSQYRATVAACTTDIVYKYAESPMCGCLTFMEVNEQNGCDELLYRDGESAIFINEQNYRERFAEYISDHQNPKWQAIAAAGYQCTLDNYEQGKEINRLADLIESII